MKRSKLLIAILALPLLAAPLSSLADLPAIAVLPRIYTLESGLTVSNEIASVGTATNLLNTLNLTHGVPVETTIVSTNSVSATMVTNYFDLSLDGSNYTSTAALTTVASITGKGTNVSLSVIPASDFDGCQKIKLTSIGTDSASNITVSVRIGLVP